MAEQLNNSVYKSGPQTFWHQGPVLWKTAFPQTEMGVDGSGSNKRDVGCR